MQKTDTQLKASLDALPNLMSLAPCYHTLQFSGTTRGSNSLTKLTESLLEDVTKLTQLTASLDALPDDIAVAYDV